MTLSGRKRHEKEHPLGAEVAAGFLGSGAADLWVAFSHPAFYLLSFRPDCRAAHGLPQTRGAAAGSRWDGVQTPS